MKYLNEVSTPELIKLIKQNLATKQDLITNPVNNNLAGMDSTGQTIDSGISTDTIKDNIYDTKSYTDQSFLYRESLAEEDCVGKLDTIKGNSLVFNQKVWKEENANILKIKGNTVKFNQLLPINTAPNRTSNGVTWTNNGDGSITANGTATANSSFNSGNWMGGSDFINDLKTRGGHYLFCYAGTGHYETDHFYLNLQGFVRDGIGIDVPDDGIIIQLSNDISTFPNVNVYPIIRNGYTVNNLVFKPYIVDLTQIFGSGNEPTTVDEFETWLSNNIGLLDYYAYTPGTLIPFTGTGLKTTGKNLLTLDIATLKTLNNSGTWNGNSYTVNGVTFDVQTNSDGQITGILANGTNTGSGTAYFIYQNSNNMNTSFAQNILGKNVILTGCPQRSGNPYIQMFNTWGTTIPIYDNGTDTAQLNVPSQINGYRCQIEVYANQTLSNVLFKPMLRLVNISDNTFEPYTENTLSLPISTLFPTGMKDVPDNANGGTIYDEIIPSRADTRIGDVDLGTLSWTKVGTAGRFDSANIAGYVKKPTSDVAINGICSYCPVVNYGNVSNYDKALSVYTNGNIIMFDSSYASSDASTFKSAMSGVMLFYELATPTSQDVSLDLEYSVYRGGTEQLLPVNGATPVTSPLNAVIDYPYGMEETEFVYKQTVSTITLISGHSYITKINGTWSNVSGTGQTLTVSDDDMVIDLTQMANPYITNYSQFTQFYPETYEFEKGRLVSFTGTGLKTVGFNQWDEEWEVGWLDGNTGLPTSETLSIRSKNYNSCIGGIEYFVSSPYDIYLYWYDSNKNFIRRDVRKEAISTAPTNAYYFKLGRYHNGTTYNNDICINISDTSKNGEYEPYTESTLSLETINTMFPTGMKSAGSVYDEVSGSKTYTRIGSVDLGTLTWTNPDTTGFHQNNEVTFKAYSNTQVANIKCSIFIADTALRVYQQVQDNSIGINEQGRVSFYSTTILPNQLSGVMLYYELATPTTTSITTNLLFDAYKGGTEEILSTSTTTPATSPIVTDMSYLGTKDTIDLSYDLLKETKEEIGVLELNSIYYGNETAI